MTWTRWKRSLDKSYCWKSDSSSLFGNARLLLYGLSAFPPISNTRTVTASYVLPSILVGRCTSFWVYGSSLTFSVWRFFSVFWTVTTLAGDWLHPQVAIRHHHFLVYWVGGISSNRRSWAVCDVRRTVSLTVPLRTVIFRTVVWRISSIALFWLLDYLIESSW